MPTKPPPKPSAPAAKKLRAHEERREAVALAYRQADAAPRVIAKGRGLIAEEIISRAREHGVYVHESPELLALLMQVDLDEHIPSQLYLAVAELLAWLHHADVLAGPLPTPPDRSGHSSA
jgi:flagellar biosynthesis protein